MRGTDERLARPDRGGVVVGPEGPKARIIAQ